MQKKAVILDRDGTLIVDKVYLNDPDAIEYLPGVFEALRMLRDDGYQFFVATNQSGIARRLVTMANLDETHRRVRDEFSKHGVDLRAFYYAPYSVESNHPVRKPNPGMLLRIAYDFDIDLRQSWMIGDRLSDVAAGVTAGCRTILLTGVEQVPAPGPHPDFVANTLLEAAKYIILNQLPTRFRETQV